MAKNQKARKNEVKGFSSYLNNPVTIYNNYHSLIEEYNDIIKDNISDKENDNL